MAITYAKASGPVADHYSVIKINDSGPSYDVIATCKAEADATAIVTALS